MFFKILLLKKLYFVMIRFTLKRQYHENWYKQHTVNPSGSKLIPIIGEKLSGYVLHDILITIQLVN